MMMRFIVYAFFLILGATISHAEDLNRQYEIKDKIEDLFEKEQFVELNEMFDHYLISEERTLSGLWKLSVLFKTLSDFSKRDTTSELFWNEREAKGLRMINALGHSSLGYLVYADILMSHAYMNKVRCSCEKLEASLREVFNKKIDQVRLFLTEHQNLLMENPRWFVLMLIIAREQGWPQQDFYELFNQAITRFPYYYQIYFEAATYMKPKWHGSDEDIEIIANKAVDATRLKEEDTLYARIYWHLLSANTENKPLSSISQVNWNAMKSSIKFILKHYPDPYNMNHFARFACLASDAEMTNWLMGLIDDQPIMMIWKGQAFYNDCRKWADDVISWEDS